MYRAMVDDGFIKSETNTISSGEKAVVIAHECRRHLYFIDSPPKMPEVTPRALLLVT
jgi:hypothetical protein